MTYLGLMSTQPDFKAGSIPVITVATRLRLAREHAKLQQGELAELMGVARNTISRAESGTVEPRRPMLLSWAMATGVPLAWILTGEEPAVAPGPGDGDNTSGLIETAEIYRLVSRASFAGEQAA